MRKSQSKNQFLHFLIFVSFCSLFLIMVIAFLSPQIHNELPLRKSLVGSIFSIISVLGMSAAFFPHPCSKVFYARQGEAHTMEDFTFKETSFKKSSYIFGIRLTHGHHPLCSPYRNHEFHLGERTFCRACMGLFIGALLSVLGAIYFLVLQHPVDIPDVLLIMVGAVGVGSGLLRYIIVNAYQGGLRFTFNAILILGMFLLLIGVDTRTQNLTLSCFLISLCIFWVFTRIFLSNATHEEICYKCTVGCDVEKRKQASLPVTLLINCTSNYQNCNNNHEGWTDESPRID
jgi:hypothetical protein